MLTRDQKNIYSEWVWTIDRLILGALVALMVIGLILTLAGSPAIAMRRNQDLFYYFNRQALFLSLAVCVLIVMSLFEARQIRRIAGLAFVVSLAMVFATLIIGDEIKGAKRWLSIAGISIQPSELLKPSFIIVAAWLFSEGVKRPDVPARTLAIGVYIFTVLPLVLQPDIGQTTLITICFAALLFLSGLRLIWVGGVLGLAVGALTVAYFSLNHVRKRFNDFLANFSAEDFMNGTSQVDKALQAMHGGGWFGRGPGEGIAKRTLPDAYTDFIAAVAVEEFGIVLFLIILGLFAFIVLRSLTHALNDKDPFIRLSIVGLAMLFGIQASINLMVNLAMIPAKGMTLPFISYGGSSLLSLCFGMGMLLALTRKRPSL